MNQRQPAWGILAAALRHRYGEEWGARYTALADGSDPDLIRWRALGGTPAAAQTTKEKCQSVSARNARIEELFTISGIEPYAIGERYGLSVSAVWGILNRRGIYKR